MTAEFIVKQTGEQLVGRLDYLFLMFDTFQEALYSNDPSINQKEQSVNSDRTLSAVDKALGRGSQASAK